MILLVPACAGTVGEGRMCADHRSQAVVDLVNEARAAEGMAGLRVDVRLVSAAQSHATGLSAGDANGHSSGDGSDLGERLEEASYRAERFGETLAEGQLSPAVVVSDWLQSPGHRDIILEARFREIGVGIAESGGPLHWVALLALNRGELAGTRGGCHPDGGVS
ncbi:MAG: CAP domain-containing protein [Longimicrobiales bacterium]